MAEDKVVIDQIKQDNPNSIPKENPKPNDGFVPIPTGETPVRSDAQGQRGRGFGQQ